MSVGGVMMAMQGMSMLYGHVQGLETARENRRIARKAYGLEIEGIERQEKRAFQKFRQGIADFNVRGNEEVEVSQDRMLQQKLLYMQAQSMQRARNLTRNISGVSVNNMHNDLMRQNLKNVSKINTHLDKVQAKLKQGKKAQKQGIDWFAEDSTYKRKATKFKRDVRIAGAKDPDPMALALNMGSTAVNAYATDKKLGNDWFSSSSTDDQSWTWGGTWDSMTSWFDDDRFQKTDDYGTTFRIPRTFKKND